MTVENLTALKNEVDECLNKFEQDKKELITERDRLYTELSKLGGTYSLEDIKASRATRQEIDDIENALKNIEAAKNKAIHDLNLSSRMIKAHHDDQRPFHEKTNKKIEEFVAEFVKDIKSFVQEIEKAITDEMSNHNELGMYLERVAREDKQLDEFQKTNISGSTRFDFSIYPGRALKQALEEALRK